ncbi:V-type ATP synthase subunit I [Thiobacillus sedimenti]|uniref:V-type ATPase 116kDa subunit family protein n=1 Tax=Thiobacillus sedimenti TaxID=3110231 RepID=A0ABZ1CRN4_9PROT|nr:V-type ATPase 116kDa subunit family protein [Thiobacillus sp. SCUT-2]WRS40578.1 V-type ATPase 116kDa subunit family protein [Thiobacillus sp. SCUT-2]
MLRAEPLLRIELLMLASEVQDATLALARFGVFSPAASALDQLAESPAAAYREAWLEADARLAKLLEQCGDTGPLQIPADAEAPALADLEELNAWLKEVWGACLACHESEMRIAETRSHLDALEETLGKLEGLDVDLARLLRQDGLLAVRIGSLPAGEARRVTEALAMSSHLVARFDQVGEQVFAVIAGPRARQDEVAGLLSQAGWHELPVPAELRTHPQAARAWLEAERSRLQADSTAACEVRDGLHDRFGPRLREARLRLALARPLAEAALAGVRGRGGLAALSGWIPKRQLDALRATLDSRFHGRYWLELREPAPRDLAEVPSLVRYPAWLAPFVPLVKSYGVPRYGEFDPVLPFAFTYLLLFGAMFGDVGHGGVLLLLALALRKRLGRLAWVGVAAGAVSMLFGLLYGSVFGFEDLLAPLWLSPLHNPERVLGIAVAFGVGFIGCTLLANIWNRGVAGRAAEALFDAGGLAGLAFYLGSVGLLASLAGLASVGRAAAVVAAAGLAAIAAYKWTEIRGTPGERMLVAFIEVLETAISLFSNTLSFMRVAAFSLNHVALALAVFTLANGMQAAGHGLTVVLGNAVIIVLEGGIVAIQALRLMYYEGFSRFFSGDGKSFVPLRLAEQ